MKKREIGNMALHFAVGGLLAAAVAWNHWMMVSATFVYAFLREQAQHRWIIGESRTVHPPTENSTQFVFHQIEKQSFFGWITGHRLWEVFQWTLGAVIGCGIAELFF